MARSTVEIQADIALTRQAIERRLDEVERMIPRRWWSPYVLVLSGLAVGVLLSRLPLLNVLGTGARTVQTGLSVAGTLAAVDRFLAEQRARRAA